MDSLLAVEATQACAAIARLCDATLSTEAAAEFPESITRETEMLRELVRPTPVCFNEGTHECLKSVLSCLNGAPDKHNGFVTLLKEYPKHGTTIVAAAQVAFQSIQACLDKVMEIDDAIGWLRTLTGHGDAAILTDVCACSDRLVTSSSLFSSMDDIHQRALVRDHPGVDLSLENCIVEAVPIVGNAFLLKASIALSNLHQSTHQPASAPMEEMGRLLTSATSLLGCQAVRRVSTLHGAIGFIKSWLQMSNDSAIMPVLVGLSEINTLNSEQLNLLATVGGFSELEAHTVEERPGLAADDEASLKEGAIVLDSPAVFEKARSFLKEFYSDKIEKMMEQATGSQMEKPLGTVKTYLVAVSGAVDGHGLGGLSADEVQAKHKESTIGEYDL